MKRLLTESIAAFLLITSSYAHASEWFEHQSKEINKADALPHNERIRTLGDIVRVGLTPYPDEEAKIIYKRSQSLLIAIPGHAEYYATRFRESYATYLWSIRGKALGEPKPVRTILEDLNPIARECSWSFQTLSLLPSVETVHVLGEMLDDETGMKEFLSITSDMDIDEQMTLAWDHPVVCIHAGVTLSKLPLKSKPPARVQGGSHMDPDDVLLWRKWYAQVKAGRRTFSFEGDPQEYDLTGPVREARNPDIPRVAKRPSSSSGAKESEDHRPVAGSSFAVIAGILLAVLLAGGYWIKSRGKRSQP